MAQEVLWEKTIGNYQCKCVKINDFMGRLTVVDQNENEILNKELILLQPYDYTQWESFCQSAIDSLQ